MGFLRLKLWDPALNLFEYHGIGPGPFFNLSVCEEPNKTFSAKQKRIFYFFPIYLLAE